MKLRVGSRDSNLAVIQAELVMAAIRRSSPGIKLELITMKTSGDRILDESLDMAGGKGLFVKELDEALLSGRVDLCVHSLKDMPAEENHNLPIVAVSRREDARDALILPLGIDSPDMTRPVGSSGGRRRAQLGEIFPGWSCKPIRGNVPTRLAKLDKGDFGALVLAVAGLRRLGLESRIHKVFEPEEILPAAGQGILAVQMRRGEDTSFLMDFHSPEAWDCAAAERAFIRAIGAGCRDTVAAFAVCEGDVLTLKAMRADARGKLCRESASGSRGDATGIGEGLAAAIMRMGDEPVE